MQVYRNDELVEVNWIDGTPGRTQEFAFYTNNPAEDMMAAAQEWHAIHNDLKYPMLVSGTNMRATTRGMSHVIVGYFNAPTKAAGS